MIQQLPNQASEFAPLLSPLISLISAAGSLRINSTAQSQEPSHSFRLLQRKNSSDLSDSRRLLSHAAAPNLYSPIASFKIQPSRESASNPPASYDFSPNRCVKSTSSTDRVAFRFNRPQVSPSVPAGSKPQISAATRKLLPNLKMKNPQLRSKLLPIKRSARTPSDLDLDLPPSSSSFLPLFPPCPRECWARQASRLLQALDLLAKPKAFH